MSRNTELPVLAGLSLVLGLLPAFAPLEWLFPTLLGPFPHHHPGGQVPVASGGCGSSACRRVCCSSSRRCQALLLLAQYGVVGMTLGAAIRLGYSASRTISWSVALPIGIGAVVLLFVSALAQQTPHAYLIHLFEQMADGLYEQLRHVEGLRDEEAMVAALEALPRTLVAVLPAVCALNFLFPNVLNYLLARRYLQHHEPPIPFAPSDVADWRATDYLVVGLSGQRRRPVPAGPGAQPRRTERLSRHPGDLLHPGPGHSGVLGAPPAAPVRGVLATGRPGVSAGGAILHPGVHGRGPVRSVGRFPAPTASTAGDLTGAPGNHRPDCCYNVRTPTVRRQS